MRVYRTRALFTAALALGCWTTVRAQGAKGSPPVSATVVVTAADATLLAREALAEAPFTFAVRLDKVEIVAPRVRVRASVPLACDITLEGTPVLRDGQIAIGAMVEQRAGMGCAAIPSLHPKPWDLARRLERASCDRNLPGPRLAGLRCVREGSLRLESMGVRADGMHVAVLVPES